MVALKLFMLFFKIGMFCFGGGYAMISAIEKEVVANELITSAQYADIVAVSQVTPGPLAVNVATYVGAVVGETASESIFYSAIATIGVSMPSMILVLIVAVLFKSFGESIAVKSVMGGIRPSIIGLIAASAILFGRLSIVDADKISSSGLIDAVNIRALVIACAAFAVNLKTNINPLFILLGSGVAGLIVFNF